MGYTQTFLFDWHSQNTEEFPGPTGNAVHLPFFAIRRLSTRKSKTRIASCELRVQIYKLRVQIHELED